MSDIIKVYCEGKAGSHDFDILEKVVDGLGVLIVPIGGKRGAKSAIQVYEAGVAKSKFKIFFRDRDFDAPVPDTESLQNDGSYVYYSYRTTIENYLLAYDCIKAYSEGKSWNSDDLKDQYLHAAKDIKFFQAARHTLGQMRVPTDFGTNIVPGKSGTLPEDLSEDFCREMGFEQIQKSIGKIKAWTKEEFDRIFDEFLALFDDHFFAEEQFLVYFQGKDFMKSLCKYLPGFSPKDYYKYAKSVFDYTKYQDLVELRQLLEAENRQQFDSVE